MFHLAVFCDSLRCGAYGTFCYGQKNVMKGSMLSDLGHPTATWKKGGGEGVSLGDLTKPRAQKQRRVVGQKALDGVVWAKSSSEVPSRLCIMHGVVMGLPALKLLRVRVRADNHGPHDCLCCCGCVWSD